VEPVVHRGGVELPELHAAGVQSFLVLRADEVLVGSFGGAAVVEVVQPEVDAERNRLEAAREHLEKHARPDIRRRSSSTRAPSPTT